jgi:hypothetical protein
MPPARCFDGVQGLADSGLLFLRHLAQLGHQRWKQSLAPEELGTALLQFIFIRHIGEGFLGLFLGLQQLCFQFSHCFSLLYLVVI